MSQRIRQPAALAAVVASLAVAGCLAGCASPTATGSTAAPPAVVQRSAGHGMPRILLTQEAARRIGVHTEVVREADLNGTRQKVVPYAAVLYDANGDTYAYSNPESLVYVRVPLRIDHIDGDQAVLSDGPPDGTALVTVGGTELLGSEFQVGE